MYWGEGKQSGIASWMLLMAALHTMAAMMIKMKFQVFIIGQLGAFGFPQIILEG